VLNFQLNDYVRINPNAPQQFSPGSNGSIVSFEPSINDEGMEIWTVEIDAVNGADVQVPIEYLQLIEKAP